MKNTSLFHGNNGKSYLFPFILARLNAATEVERMALMFPTIYGIALKGMGDDAKLASAGLILAIGGGCLMPPLQGLLIDKAVWFDSLSSVRISFVLPLICFLVIAAFGWWVRKDG
jgi:FHS family L-fucose permease-like MFS transporter